jgi:hypothetical protein
VAPPPTGMRISLFATAFRLNQAPLSLLSYRFLGLFQRFKKAKAWSLNSHFQLLKRLRMYRALPPPPHTSLCCNASHIHHLGFKFSPQHKCQGLNPKVGFAESEEKIIICKFWKRKDENCALSSVHFENVVLHVGSFRMHNPI